MKHVSNGCLDKYETIDILLLSGKHETMDTFSASKNTFRLEQCMGCD